MSATPGLTVYPKGVLLETLRRRIIALQEDGYNDGFLRAIREAHRELERKEARLAEAEQLLREYCASECDENGMTLRVLTTGEWLAGGASECREGEKSIRPAGGAPNADSGSPPPSTGSTASQPASALDSQDSYRHPIHQVYFRAGLLACREYMARFVEVESPSIAASIRANWWPSLGKDFGPPRLLKWEELTEGEYGEESFRALTKDEISPTLEALPVALGFLERERTGGQPAAVQEWEPPPPTVLTDDECDHIADFMERREWQGIGKDDVRLWAKAFDELPYLRAADNSSASDQPAAGGLQSPASGGADT